MTRPRLAWRDPTSAMGAPVPILQDLRDDYGVVVAEAIEACAELVREMRAAPEAQDIKHTIRTLGAHASASRTESVGSDEALCRMVQGLESSESEVRLLRAGLDLGLPVRGSRERTPELRRLSPSQLAACASKAIDDWGPARPGRRSLDFLLVPLVKQLLAIPGEPAERDALIGRALRACRVGYSPENIRRLRDLATKD